MMERSQGFDAYKRDTGVCHGDDLMYLFPMNPPGFPKAVETKDQKTMQTRLLDIITSFSSSGTPRIETNEEERVLSSQWTPHLKNMTKFKVKYKAC